MNILAFDTSSEILAVGVLKGERDRASLAVEGIRHSETLIPAIGECLKRLGLAIVEINLIGCSIGPGSFMGLRIGISTAKGLSLALGIPWVGVPTLDAMARTWAASGRTIVPIIDARKNRVYAAIYRGGLRSGDYLDCSIADILGKLEAEENLSFVGPDADILTEYCLERPGFAVEKDRPEARALDLAELAGLIYATEGPSPEYAGPLYLREPEIG
ncbi:MAG: tRNA (adenosine(37)-N6)-threonylcarbamoyltransferase complex dimerization subunit type 1 TsaB [Spirochaetes bacterium]|nr:tRNA (adenosine(37)-N6)-threonylcarbamoyltransferase complex dimerization subunit type 1 TsaB [Spirochaetota bacterium]